jgi:hypothetical protein
MKRKKVGKEGKKVTEMAAGNGWLPVDHSGGACTLYAGKGGARWGNQEG